MGKVNNQSLPVVQQQISGTVSRRSCPVGVFRFINFKCAVVLTLSVVVFVSAVFWAIPIQYRHVGFDAKDFIKRSATVQACFRLKKPVPGFVPYIARLEYDITGEISIPSSKVAVLSMHQEGKSEWTKVVFGFLPDPINSTVNIVSLSLLKSSLIDIFLQEFNLTVTDSLFGEPSSFEILKFPGGITIIPEQTALVLVKPQPLFDFTLNSSINEIRTMLMELKGQLKAGLLLMPNEVIFIQVTNKYGSTIDPPVIVEASIVSDVGNLPTERLKHLAQIVSGHAKNLGLDHSVFGKVKEISLSSTLNHSLQAPTRTLRPSPSPSPSPDQVNDYGPSLEPSPSPSPEQVNDYGPSLEPSPSPSPEQVNDYGPSLEPSPPPPAFSPDFHYAVQPAPNRYASAPSDAIQNLHPPNLNNIPHYSLPPMVHSPKTAHGNPRIGSNDLSRPPTPDPDHMFPTTAPPAATKSSPALSVAHILPNLSPLPAVTYGSRHQEARNIKKLVSSTHALSTSSWSRKLEIGWFNAIGILGLFLLI